MIPSANDGIPRIEAALAKGKFSSKREADKLTDTCVLRVRDAYRALTGKKGLTYRSLSDDTTLDPKGAFADALPPRLRADAAASTAFRPNVRDDGQRPSSGQDAGVIVLICPTG